MSNNICLITGDHGLIGSECVRYFKDKFRFIVGIDNNGRAEFFGKESSTYITNTPKDTIDYYHGQTTRENYETCNSDISDRNAVDAIFKAYGHNIDLIIHTAAQPSHDWAATNPHRDFEVNALGTLNLLEAYRKYCPEAVFIFTSTNKVYGDRPNTHLKMYEQFTRYEACDRDGPLIGVKETMSIDQCTHSLFGVSKAYADLAVQEYGRYFGLKTGVFRGGCLTGGAHKGAEQHGFLSYLVKCIKHEKPYTIYGYRGKQVRDQIHSRDVCQAFDLFYRNPKPGKVYNIGGGRHSNSSVLEAIDIIERKTGKKAILSYDDIPRRGDHQWYISDISAFQKDFPEFKYTYTLDQIIDEIIQTA